MQTNPSLKLLSELQNDGKIGIKDMIFLASL